MPLNPQNCNQSYCDAGIDLSNTSASYIGLLSRDKQQHYNDYHFPDLSFVDGDKNEFEFHRNKDWCFTCACENKYRLASSVARHVKSDDCDMINQILDSDQPFESAFTIVKPKVKKAKLEVEDTKLLAPVLVSLQAMTQELQEMRKDQDERAKKQDILWEMVLKRQEDDEKNQRLIDELKQECKGKY